VSNNLQCKIVMCGEEKTQEVTQSTFVDEFGVNFKMKNVLSKWREQGVLHNESTGSKFVMI
jgi:hypothetical protein